jgi:hypothetical protein
MGPTEPETVRLQKVSPRRRRICAFSETNTACRCQRRIAQFIDGRDAVRAHGTADMPVWGEKLYSMGEGERGELGIGEVIGTIVAYLNTIQDHRRVMR